MGVRVPLALLPLLVFLPGCVEMGSGLDCRRGSEELFLVSESHGGFGPPEIQYEHTRRSIDRDGDFFFIDGMERPGSGRVQPARGGTLHNLSPAQVRAELERMGAFDDRTDYNVSSAWRQRVSASDFDRICDSAAKEIYTDHPRSDDRVGCADGGTTTFRLSTGRGVRTPTWRCESSSQDANEFEAVQRFMAVLGDVQYRVAPAAH